MSTFFYALLLLHPTIYMRQDIHFWLGIGLSDSETLKFRTGPKYNLHMLIKSKYEIVSVSNF